MKDKVYQTRCPKLTQLKRRIAVEVRSFYTNVLQNMLDSNEARLRTVIRENAAHFEHFQHPVEGLRDTEYQPKV